MEKIMSAYVVGHDHIDALLTFATADDPQSFGPISYRLEPTGNRVEITTLNATEIGRKLLTENERSVNHRYPGDDDLPGTIGEEAAGYTFRPWAKAPDAIAILKGCDCFDYQACETDDYRASDAFRIIDAIRARAISRLPGYTNAPGWEFRRQK
jgi:hypothetical protein